MSELGVLCNTHLGVHKSLKVYYLANAYLRLYGITGCTSYDATTDAFCSQLFRKKNLTFEVDCLSSRLGLRTENL